MIQNTGAGWSRFMIGDFSGTPSYITDVPLDLLDAFIHFFETGSSSCWFDEEGSWFTLVLNPFSIFIIEEKEKPILHDLSEFSTMDLAKELVQDIRSDLKAWCRFDCGCDTMEDGKENGKIFEEKLRKLEKLIQERENKPEDS